MKILFDYQIFSIQKYGGATKYFCELMKNIPSEHQFNVSLLFSDNCYLKENYKYFKKINILPDKNFPGKHFIQQKIDFFNQYNSKHCISANNFDLFHPTYFDNYFLKILKKPYIITVHDLIAFKFKDSLFKDTKAKPQMEKVIKNANRIISISENTKKDLVDILNVPPEKIDVVYHGYNKSYIQNKANQYGNYILFVGSRKGYKNFRTFAKAISYILSRESGLKLICVGQPFNKEEISDLRTLKILGQTIALNVTENILNDLYHNALVFVYPSLYEGFGMPILEAFANNCPVCLSDSGSMREIAENCGVYFDPDDYESIINAIEKIIYDRDFTKQKIEAGKTRLENFSWKKCAEQTIKSYKKALL